jgi:ribosome-associated protein
VDRDRALVVSPELSIPLDEIEIWATTSGGPGGQHANRSRTRIEVRFDAATSSALTDAQRSAITSKLGDVVRAGAEDERSQQRNRVLALERLADQLRDSLVRRTPRRATRPSRGSVERRLDAKRQQAQRKADRRRPDD